MYNKVVRRLDVIHRATFHSQVTKKKVSGGVRRARISTASGTPPCVLTQPFIPSFTPFQMQEDVRQLPPVPRQSMANNTILNNSQWGAIPTEILLHIASLLPLENQVILSYVCRNFYIGLGSSMRRFAVCYYLCSVHCDSIPYHFHERLELLRLLDQDGLIARGKLICSYSGTLHDISRFSLVEQDKSALQRKCGGGCGFLRPDRYHRR